MRTCTPFLLLAGLLAAAPAYAGTIQKINEDRDKLIIGLSKAELAVLEEGEVLVMELGKERYQMTGVVLTLNAEKQTALVELDMIDERLERKMPVRFLSHSWNTPSSPIIGNYGQYHQYSRSFLEARAGAIYEALTVEDGSTESKSTSKATGMIFGAEGYALFNPQLIGGGLAYERRSVSIDAKEDGGDYGDEVTVNQLRPGLWLEIEPGWRLGMRYDYSMITVEHDSEALRGKYDYNVGEPRLAVLRRTKQSEWGAEYKDKDKFDTTVTVTTQSNIEGNFGLTIRTPAEASVFYRTASTPQFAWGAAFGYVFYERGPALEGGELGPKPKVPELLRLRASFEYRRDTDDKIDWGLTYDGAKSPGIVVQERAINAVGAFLTYLRPLLEPAQGLQAGGTLSLFAGTNTVENDGTDAVTGETAVYEDKYTGYGAQLLLFISRDFDVDMRRRKAL